jgi:hypothetical protein
MAEILSEVPAGMGMLRCSVPDCPTPERLYPVAVDVQTRDSVRTTAVNAASTTVCLAHGDIVAKEAGGDCVLVRADEPRPAKDTPLGQLLVTFRCEAGHCTELIYDPEMLGSTLVQTMSESRYRAALHRHCDKITAGIRDDDLA